MPHSLLSAAPAPPADRSGPVRPGWRRRAWRWCWRVALGLLLAAWAGAVAAWITVQWLILPRLDEWRPRAETIATRALGHPVQIGALATLGGGWLPMFELRDVVLRDPTGAPALHLPRVQAALSVPSLLALRLRFTQLLVEDAQLDVRRDAAGRFYVGGLPVGSGSAVPAGADDADWLFEQHEIVVRGGTLRWLDDLRQAPPLALSDVQLVLRNRGRRHALRLDATPPPAWGDRFAVIAQARGALLSRPGDWRRWQGSMHAALPRADVTQLRRHFSLPVDLQQGRAALRAWLDFDGGAPQALTLDAALRDVAVQLGPQLEPVALATLDGRLVVERQGGGAVRLALQDLAFSLPDGSAWAPSRLALQWHAAPAPATTAAAAASAARQPPAPASEALVWLPPLDGGQLTADRLDLPLLAALAERLPIGAGVRALLRELDPEGTVRQLDARWDGPLDQPRSWSAKASGQGLAITAAASPEPGGIGRPGWRGADLQIDARHTGGSATLTLTDGQLALPGVFADPVVSLAHFAAQLEWTVTPAPAGAPADTPPAVALKVLNARFDNADARGALNAAWHTGTGPGFGKGGRLPGVLQMDGTLAEGRAAQVARYLPLGIGTASRQWTQRAVRGGELRDVAFHVQGDLWDFPFVNRRDGSFRIAGKLQGVTLAPVPSVPPGGAEPAWDSPWPVFTNISGELVFDRNSMQFSRTRGSLGGVALDDVAGGIADLDADPPRLQVDGNVRGPLADLLRVVRGTALAEATGHLLDATTGTGSADLRLGLAVPLGHTVDSELKVALQLPGNDLRLRPDLPLLAGARGRIEATHKGLQLGSLRGQLLGGEAVVDAQTLADGSLRLTVNGVAAADALRRAPELGLALPRLAQRLQGQATYRFQASLQSAAQGGRSDWQLASNLQGLAIDLPAPLGKPAEQALALRLASSPDPRPPGAAATPARDWLRLDLGPLRGAVLADSASGRALRSAWSWDAPLPEPVPGGRAVLTVPRLDADGWRSAAAALAGPGGSAGDDSGWLPQALQLQAGELLLGGRRVSGLVLDLQRLPPQPDTGDGWRAQFKADQAAGTLDYREARSAGASGRLRAQLARLSLPDEVASGATDPVAQLSQAADRAGLVLPAVDLEIADFELRGRKLGSLSLQAAYRAAATDLAGRGVWQVQLLRLKNDDAQLLADGQWDLVPGSPRRRLALKFQLDVANGGALLERLGFGKVLRGASGRLAGDLGWEGSPLALDLPSLSGRIAMDMKGGQFLQLDPGAARLLGVMSLQSLPRRLVLDFRDVFQQGFAFDAATAQVTVARGVASTDNLRLRGLQALVAMAGSADIGRETQDLHVVVVPEITASGPTLAYAAVNPAIGLGAFVGQWLLREPLRLASAREFRITGHWDDPKVERLERGLLDPLPASATARNEAGSAPAPAAPAPAASRP